MKTKDDQLPPSGTITFLFTDIEKSTLLWERHRSNMRPVLAYHDALLRSAVEDHGGWVVKTTGDGLHAAFPTALNALTAAIDGQRRLTGSDWSAIAPDDLRVRMGLHTGEAELRDGDYYGTAVNRAARIMSLGHGGQILLSSATASLLQPHLPDMITINDLGRVTIRGVQGDQRIFQLLAPDLPQQFPPLNAAQEQQGNLPAHISSFIGRFREMNEIRAALAQTRLLTLTGPGGTGKSRIALQIARDGQAAYEYGSWLVELAPLSDPQLVPSTVAAVFGLQSQAIQQIENMLIDFLREKDLLLILDNCEHLIDACARLAANLMRGCPSVTILASSREGLGIPGERTYHMPTLSLPLRDTKLDDIKQSEAVQLFVERAGAAQQGFQINNDNAAVIADIVRRLDGIPLAIELAAARLKVFTVQQIDSRLDHRFRLLTGGSRTAMPRQQTLRALIDWSYDLLDEEERRLFRLLSIFKGGWTFEAAEITAFPLDIYLLMPQLIDKSLVAREAADGDEPAEPRYRYLETIRQYALDRLIEKNEVEEARDRHFLYFEEKSSEFLTKDSNIFVLELSNLVYFDQDNLRSAMEWGIERYPHRALVFLWNVSLMISDLLPGFESIEWANAALERLDSQGASPDYEEARYKGLVTLGLLNVFMGQLEDAYNLSAELIVDLADYKDNLLLLPLSHFIHAQSGLFLERPDAVSSVEKALKLLRAKPDSQLSRWFLAMVLMISARIKHDTGNPDQSEADLQEIFEILGVSKNFPWTEYMRFMMMMDLDSDLQSMQEQYDRTIELLTRIRNRRLAAMISSDWAHRLHREQQYDRALAIYIQMFITWRDLGHQSAMANILENIAFIYCKQGRAESAVSLLGAADRIRHKIDQDMLPAEREIYKQKFSELKAQIPPEMFDQLWIDGRNLSVDALIELISEP